MIRSLPQLEKRRTDLLMLILGLGDFRSGSITATQGRCGNPNCRCHKPGESGHGPNLRLTYKANGKTVTESFSSPAELSKAQREVDAFHRFRELSRELLAVNEEICKARPVEESAIPQEKKRRKRSNRQSPPK
jgi:hypothetical protein